MSHIQMISLSNINANLLVALDLLLTHQSVQGAAEKQHVTASAMSHSLRTLRELFDDPLLTRTRGGMIRTPFAEQLMGPLHRALRDLERAVTMVAEFDPSRAERGFIIAAPDFLSTLLLPPIVRILEREAPGLDVEIRPIARAGALRFAELARLADGEIDLLLAAVLTGTPGQQVPEIRSRNLYEESFVCVVRGDHSSVGDTLDLDTYAALPHLLITITDERSPSWIDEELARYGLTRRVAVRTRYFMSAPLLIAQSDLILTCPRQLAHYFAKHAPLRLLEPPLPLPSYFEQIAWHTRFDADPASLWLRSVLTRSADEMLVRDESRR
jgi:DNA-binding transcriptional LysR family regulator